MSIHINDILDYLDAHPVCCYDGSVKTLMEMLYDVYTAYNTIDSDEIHNLLKQFHSILEPYPADSADRLYSAVCSLCQEHEVLAFSHGIVVGMYFMSEVRTLP